VTSSRTAPQWRGYVNQITYGTDLRAPVDDSLLSRLADELIRQRYFRDPVETYYQAAIDALQSSESVRLDDDQDEGAVRDLLNRLLRELDERRPWPEPPFRSLPIDVWQVLQDAPVIGRLSAYPMDVQARLYRSFSGGESSSPESRVIVLRLRSGQEVGLRAASFSEPHVDMYSTSDPESTRAAFQDLTGLDVQPPDPDEGLKIRH
jgi:hypothetical protein